jgi:hypothetical protein
MVGHIPLEDGIGVRIPTWQPNQNPALKRDFDLAVCPEQNPNFFQGKSGR